MATPEANLIMTVDKIDAFHLLRQSKAKCAFKGCPNSGRVKLFWREKPEETQRVSYICIKHALELANNVLGVYKFNQEPE